MRSRGMPACWGHVPGMPVPDCLWPMAVTVMDATVCVGRQNVLYGLSPSAMQETGILGARHWEAPNLPVCSTCFVHPCHGPSPEEEVGPLLSLPEQDDLSMSHLQHGMDPVSLETMPN